MSSFDNSIHFGLGNKNKVKSIEILWPDGKYEKILNPNINEKLKVFYKNSSIVEKNSLKFPLVKNKSKTLLNEVSDKKELTYNHKQIDKADFNIQRLIPRKISESSPKIKKGDLNNDGIEDRYDNCNETPINEIPNEEGCSASQRDTDGDGIVDSLDICWGDDSTGDSDGDGLCADGDQCPDGPFLYGEEVDDNGCSYFEKPIPWNNLELCLTKVVVVPHFPKSQ